MHLQNCNTAVLYKTTDTAFLEYCDHTTRSTTSTAITRVRLLLQYWGYCYYHCITTAPLPRLGTTHTLGCYFSTRALSD
eukprot:1239780-Pyramimonas_sp.AAC.1